MKESIFRKKKWEMSILTVKLIPASIKEFANCCSLTPEAPLTLPVFELNV